MKPSSQPGRIAGGLFEAARVANRTSNELPVLKAESQPVSCGFERHEHARAQWGGLFGLQERQGDVKAKAGFIIPRLPGLFFPLLPIEVTEDCWHHVTHVRKPFKVRRERLLIGLWELDEGSCPRTALEAALLAPSVRVVPPPFPHVAAIIVEVGDQRIFPAPSFFHCAPDPPHSLVNAHHEPAKYAPSLGIYMRAKLRVTSFALQRTVRGGEREDHEEGLRFRR
mmetsp:Transcript_16648/g.31122  ORF Transcript_16648/g.31122 Transcript_16648/m.31122 type:complete len:225 (-) Transcript_16648:637-1311(-)